MTLWYSRVTPAGPILTLAEAKIHLKVVATDTTKDADISAKLAEAEEYIFATLGAAADPSWDATSAPHVVRNAIKIALEARSPDCSASPMGVSLSISGSLSPR